MKSMLSPEIMDCIQRALQEDIGSGDVTTDRVVPLDAWMIGEIIAKQAGIVAGLDVTQAVFGQLDDRIQFTANIPEGARVETRQLLATISGPARPVLSAERTALNFLGRMSGIATLTNQMEQAVAGTRAVILDTCKTAPGLRALDKLAVQRGGGQNHRFGLYGRILIKDNHIDFAGSLTEAVRRARIPASNLELEVEARTLDDVETALRLGVRRIMLDNMTLDTIRRAVGLNAGRAKLEVSGNVTLANVRQIAEAGVDYVSSGALTHSASVFDVSLRWTRSMEEPQNVGE
jgi:nicotinate-nucleotide pyrophosphorylase (carboxylating)